MSNYYGIGRTNYFRVKDPELFKNDLINKYSGIHIESEERESKTDPSIAETWFCLFDDNPDGGGWNITIKDENEENCIPIDLWDILSEYLVDTDVTVIIQVGSEKYKYGVGTACAVNSKNEQIHISINDIYKLAVTLGPVITEAYY